MRLPADDERLALATVAAAAEAGVSVFDTARAYAPSAEELGHNERLLARALRACGAVGARVVTKGGMRRPGGGWVPDGRAKAIAADCEASLEALDGLPIDLYLLHAPDPRTPWGTSVRALARLVEQGMVARVGVSNVNRTQLDEALALAPLTAVQVGLSVFDDHAVRGGVVDRCAELGIAVLAHSPLGGPRRARGVGRLEALSAVAAARGVSAAEVALVWLLELPGEVVAIPGARRPETARSAASAASLKLDARDRERLAPRAPRHRAARSGSDVVMIMGIPGAGKSVIAADYVARGYARLNRDERGGSLREIAQELERQLEGGAHGVVLDNTYLSRAARHDIVAVAGRHGAKVHCIWLDTSLDQAQVNLVERLLERFGSLPTPEELRVVARREPWLMLPTSQMRALRELEPPAIDEGFESVERRSFSRSSAHGGRGVLVAARALDAVGAQAAIGALEPAAPHLLYDWRPGGTAANLAQDAARLSAIVSGPVDVAICPHGGGPPACWCRPPLPGLPLAFARTRGVHCAVVVGVAPTHRTLARTLGARYIDLAEAPGRRSGSTSTRTGS
jgi:aryl-alcohol dehydrogenase-like predicted oxidoreductase/adenylate kinase family enzyme